MEQSKNEKAGKICGYRPKGTALCEPGELDYKCPICKTESIDVEFGEMPEDGLKWSEYFGFCWCPVCNIDIPSFFCIDPKVFEEWKNGKKNYLEDKISSFLYYIEELRKGVIRDIDGEELGIFKNE